MTKNKPSSTEELRRKIVVALGGYHRESDGKYLREFGTDLNIKTENFTPEVEAIEHLIHQKQQEARNQLLAELEVELPTREQYSEEVLYGDVDDTKGTVHLEWQAHNNLIRALLKSKEEKV